MSTLVVFSKQDNPLMSLFTCMNCRREFESGWNMDQADLEFYENFSRAPDENDVIVCQHCNNNLMEFFIINQTIEPKDLADYHQRRRRFMENNSKYWSTNFHHWWPQPQPIR